MKIELNVKDRLTLVTILPSQGKMTDLVEVLELIKLIKFSDEERDIIKYTEQDGRIMWDTSKDIPKEIDINYEQLRIVKDVITKLDNEGKISFSILDTCLKFNKL